MPWLQTNKLLHQQGGNTERCNAEQFLHAAGEKLLDLGCVVLIRSGIPRQPLHEHCFVSLSVAKVKFTAKFDLMFHIVLKLDGEDFYVLELLSGKTMLPPQTSQSQVLFHPPPSSLWPGPKAMGFNSSTYIDVRFAVTRTHHSA